MMREYFEEQLKNTKPLTTESIKLLSDPTKYVVGDKILYMMEETREEIDSNRINISVISITERELDSLTDKYEFLRFATNFPLFRLKQENK